MKPLCLTPLKKSSYQTQSKTLSEPPRLGAGALRSIWTPRLDPNEIQLEGKGVFSLYKGEWGMTLQKPVTPIWAQYVWEKFQAFWGFLFFCIHVLYETRSCCLRYLMGCGIFKTLWNICSAFKCFWSQSLNSAVYSTLGVTVWRQCLLPHVELISIDAINSVWIKSLLSSLGMVWIGRLDVPKSN